ncbi:MAG TPA: hypothetical protein VF476_00340 [Chitinophagaceae bacterium]
MKKLLVIVSLFFCAVYATAQKDSSFTLIKTISGDIVDFAVDNLDNIYVLNSRNQLKKLNANGDSVAVFNDIKRFGKATLVDVSNPLKIILYYKDFGSIVVLDRFLNAVNTIDLRKQNILQAKAIGLSYDNKIWVYDELENKLKKVDEEGKLLQETADFRLLFDKAPVPQKLFDQDKYVYLYDSAQAVFVFDYYGTLKNKILINGWRNFKVAGKYIFGDKAGILYRYEISNFQYDEWNMPQELIGSRSFNFSSSRLYALKKDSIEIYSLR